MMMSNFRQLGEYWQQITKNKMVTYVCENTCEQNQYVLQFEHITNW